MPPSKNGRVTSLVPTQIKWDEVGNKVEGMLMNKEITTFRDQQRGRYIIRAIDGLKVVLGTFQIDQALQLVAEGEYIGIEYLGDEGTNTGNRFKLFDIWVDDDPTVAAPEEVRKVDVATGEVEAKK